MERYKARAGAVLTTVCGEYLLVTVRALRGLCPFVTRLNESSAFLWNRLLEGATEEELFSAVAEEYEVEDLASVRRMIREFLEQMQEMHYLETQEEEEHEE